MWQMYFCTHKTVSQKLFVVAKRNTSWSSVAADCAKAAPSQTRHNVTEVRAGDLALQLKPYEMQKCEFCSVIAPTGPGVMGQEKLPFSQTLDPISSHPPHPLKN